MERETTGYEPLREAQTVVAGEGGVESLPAMRCRDAFDRPSGGLLLLLCCSPTSQKVINY